MSAILEDHEAKILARSLEFEGKTFPPEFAKAIIDMKLDNSDKRRLKELSRKNKDGTLSAKESRELQGYLNVGMFVDLLKAKAYASLNKVKQSRKQS
jgi:hypothetical protein